MLSKKEHRALIFQYRVKPAIYEEQTEIGLLGLDKGRQTCYRIERTIWRPIDVPLLRVVIAESLNTEFTNVRKWEDLKTRTIEYVPTGAIYYDNYAGPTEAILFEYRLKEARDLRFKGDSE